MRLLTALTLTALLAGCGGDEPEPPPTQQPEESAQPAEPLPAAPRPEPDTAAEGPESEATVGDRRLYTVQVAAFLNAVTAREWTEELQDQEIPVWTSTARVDGRMFHRLRLGALAELSDARRLADMIRARYHWPVWVAPLTSSDRLPLNAVQRTREALRSGR